MSLKEIGSNSIHPDVRLFAKYGQAIIDLQKQVNKLTDRINELEKKTKEASGST